MEQLDPATDVQPLNTESAKEETSTDTSKPEDHTSIPPTTNRPEHQPSEVSADTDHTEYHSSKHHKQNTPAITTPIGRHPRTRDRQRKLGQWPV